MTYSIAASKLGTGKYSVYFTLWNSSGVGNINTEHVEFIIVDNPSYSTIGVDKKIYNLSDIVKITVNAVHATGATIGIDKIGVGRITTENTGMTYSIAASKLGAGKYSAYFTLWNSSGVGNINTECVEFTIECDNHSYSEIIAKQSTCTEIGEKVFTCTVCGVSKMEVIPATGHQHTEIRNKKIVTIEQDGYTGDIYCRDCNMKLLSGMVIKKLTITGVVSNEEVKMNDYITISAMATGGVGEYTYSFLIHNLENDTWYRWPFDKSAEHIWMANRKGKREFFVEAKDAAGNVIRSDAMKVTVKEKEAPLVITGNVSAAQVEVGNTVKFNASAAGGTGNYTYSFLIHNLENDVWYRWGFDKSAQHNWTAIGTGKREFFVEVKDAAGKVVRSSAMKVTVKSAEVPLAVTGKVSTSQVTAGNTVTISATATGGKGGYTYSFLVHNLANDSWYRFGSFTTAFSYTWTAGSVGTREFFVEAKDSNNTIVRSNTVTIVVK